MPNYWSYILRKNWKKQGKQDETRRNGKKPKSWKEKNTDNRKKLDDTEINRKKQEETGRNEKK